MAGEPLFAAKVGPRLLKKIEEKALAVAKI